MNIPDPMFQGPPSTFEMTQAIKQHKKLESKKKATQSFAKAHSKRKKK